MEMLARRLTGRVIDALGRGEVEASGDRVTEGGEMAVVVGVAGPRGCGKTMMAGQICAEREGSVYLNAGDPEDLAKLEAFEDYLEARKATLVCVDEIQRVPGLFPVLGRLVAAGGAERRFLLCGSVSPEWMRTRMEEAGLGAQCFEMGPLTEEEAGWRERNRLWMRGGFPESFLAADGTAAGEWLEGYVNDMIERDLPRLGVRVPGVILRRFWQMAAHAHGELWNGARLADALGTTAKTAVHYRDLLEDVCMVRVLPAWVPEGTRRRIVKAPRAYLRDTGILHRLLRLDDFDALFGHPVRGASWKSYVIEEIAVALPEARLFFYRTARGAGADLVIRQQGRLEAVEIVAHSAPRVGKQFRAALVDLAPARGWVVAPVREGYAIGDGIRVAPPGELCEALRGEAAPTTPR